MSNLKAILLTPMHFCAFDSLLYKTFSHLGLLFSIKQPQRWSFTKSFRDGHLSKA